MQYEIEIRPIKGSFDERQLMSIYLNWVFPSSSALLDIKITTLLGFSLNISLICCITLRRAQHTFFWSALSSPTLECAFYSCFKFSFHFCLFVNVTHVCGMMSFFNIFNIFKSLKLRLKWVNIIFSIQKTSSNMITFNFNLCASRLRQHAQNKMKFCDHQKSS